MFYDTEDLQDGAIRLQLERTAEGYPEKGWVPAYYFGICLPDGTRIGQCDLRIGHNDRLYIGGNSIHKSFFMCSSKSLRAAVPAGPEA